MYTYYNYEYEIINGNKSEKNSISFNSMHDPVSKLFELSEMLCNSLKRAKNASVFKLSLYALDETKAKQELAADSYTNYHGDLWECTEFCEGFYFAPCYNNYNKTLDFVITEKLPFKIISEISPFNAVWTR